MTDYTDLIAALRLPIHGAQQEWTCRKAAHALAALTIERDASNKLAVQAFAKAEALAGEVERWEKNHEALQDKIDCMKSCGCAYDAAGDICGHHSPKLLAAEAERDRMKAALQQIASQKSFAELEAGTEDDDVDYDLIGAWDIVIGVARKAVGGAS